MGWWRWLLSAAIGLPVLVIGAGQLGLLRGKPPDGLGVRDGRLKRPAFTPNSVSSQADLHPEHPMRQYARIAPLPAHPDGAAAVARLRTVIATMPGATIVESKPDYLYARFETRLMRFVDDAEFWYDPSAHAIQVRSASRVGRKDFGVNRQRVESIRAALAAAP
jgi:uncharacterized protein (DUF1499 family)